MIRRRRPPRGASGQALIEVLLAAAIGVALAAALAQLFVGSSRAGAATASRAALQESARHAFEFLRRSARSAGYVGCGIDGSLASALNGVPAPPEVALLPAVAGFDGAADGRALAWRPPLSALPVRGPGAPAFRSRNRLVPARLRPGTDVVVFRRVDVGVPLAQQMRRDGDPVSGLDPDRTLARTAFAVVSTCRQAALFRATSSRAAGGVTRLRHAAGGGPFGNRPGAQLAVAGLPYGGGDGPAGARVGPPLVEVYFVGRRARDTGAPARAGAPAWALWRKSGTAPPAELVAGIDDLQLLFGIDAVPDDGSRLPQRYVTADAVGASAIRSLRLAITATAAVAPGEPALRRTFTQTVALRN